MYDHDLNELETLYRTAPVGLGLVDRDLRYVRINERLAAINGKPPGEHIGRTIREIIPEIASQVEPIFRRVFESGEPILDVETSGTLPAEPEVERSWRCSYYPIKSPDGMVERVSLVVEDITALKRAKQLLEERLQFETLLSDLSATFTNLPDSALDPAIARGLERIIETLNIDRVSLLELSEDKTRLMIAHIYEHPGAPPFPGLVAGNLSPWILEKIRRGEMLVLSRCPDDLPEEAIPERQYCRQRGLKSHLTLPLSVGGSILGAMAFGSYRRYVTWSEDLIQRLRIAANVFTNTLVRKRAEEALKTERQRLFTLLDGLPAFVAIKAPDYSIRYANRFYREVFGNTQGKRCYELLGREGPCDGCRQIRVFETGEPQNFESTWIKPGQTFQVYQYPFAEVDGSLLVLSLGFDITERKQAEDALRETRETQRALLNAIPESIFLVGAGGVIVAANETSAKRLGKSLDELIGSKMSELLPSEVVKKRKVYTDEAIKTGRAVHFEDMRDGRFLYNLFSPILNAEGKVSKLAVFSMDITERELAEESSKENLRLRQQILDTIPRPIFYKGIDGRYQGVNQAFLQFYGKTMEQVLGKTVHEVFSKEIADKYFQVNQHHWQHPGPQIYEFHTYDAQGQRREVVVHNATFIDKNGSIAGLAGVMIDVTERKEAEVALQASEEALRKSQESYQSLAGQLLNAQEAERRRLARELHDDLTQRAAALAIEAARLEHQHQSSQGAIAGKMKEMKEKLEEMCKDIQAISRRLHPSVLDDLGLADAVHSECTNFAQQQGIVVNYGSENILPGVPPDIALYIYRIIQESLRNIARHARATEVDISLVGQDDAIHLSVKDNGIGFNPLKVKKGTLGLVSMKERVNLAHGDFSIQSQPGQGTVIEVLVPLSRSPLHEPHPDIAGR
jgi:PAS domain S-box-containing protein